MKLKNFFVELGIQFKIIQSPGFLKLVKTESTEFAYVKHMKSYYNCRMQYNSEVLKLSDEEMDKIIPLADPAERSSAHMAVIHQMGLCSHA